VRVAIGAVAGTLGGPATYARELVRALSEEFPSDDFTVVTDRPDLFAGTAQTIRVPLPSAWGQPLWDHVGVPWALRHGRFDLYHGTKGVLPRALRLPGVVTIHDMANYVMPETFSRAQRIHLQLETPSTIRRATALITDSRSTAHDLERFFPETTGRIDVIPVAAPSWLRVPSEAEVLRWKAARGIRKPCIGYLGTVQPRKNLEVLARAFRQAGGGHDWILLVAGRCRPGYRPSCLDGTDPRMVYLGPIADEDVPLFLASLSCMVSPSSYEGFGLTLLEALTVGCPVIAVANSSVPEVVGDAGVLVSAPDAGTLAQAISSIVTDPDRAAELRRRALARAALFSWTSTARLTRAVYARACGGSAPDDSERP
jgi:glycosyltransferase involved in cell wall biosynthesis